MADTVPTRLLDYFAGQALTGLIARSDNSMLAQPLAQPLATRAYEIARAMMDEHQKNLPEFDATIR